MQKKLNVKIKRLKSGGFVSSGTDAGDLQILRTAKNIDDGSGMKSGGYVKKMKKGKKIKGKKIPAAFFNFYFIFFKLSPISTFLHIFFIISFHHSIVTFLRYI